MVEKEEKKAGGVIALGVLAAAGIAAYFLRCKLFGIDCEPIPPEGEVSMDITLLDVNVA